MLYEKPSQECKERGGGRAEREKSKGGKERDRERFPRQSLPVKGKVQPQTMVSLWNSAWLIMSCFWEKSRVFQRHSSES